MPLVVVGVPTVTDRTIFSGEKHPSLAQMSNQKVKATTHYV